MGPRMMGCGLRRGLLGRRLGCRCRVRALGTGDGRGGRRARCGGRRRAGGPQARGAVRAGWAAAGAGLGVGLGIRLRPCVRGDVDVWATVQRAGAGSRPTLGTRRHSSRPDPLHLLLIGVYGMAVCIAHGRSSSPGLLLGQPAALRALGVRTARGLHCSSWPSPLLACCCCSSQRSGASTRSSSARSTSSRGCSWCTAARWLQRSDRPGLRRARRPRHASLTPPDPLYCCLVGLNAQHIPATVLGCCWHRRSHPRLTVKARRGMPAPIQHAVLLLAGVDAQLTEAALSIYGLVGSYALTRWWLVVI